MFTVLCAYVCTGSVSLKKCPLDIVNGIVVIQVASDTALHHLKFLFVFDSLLCFVNILFSVFRSKKYVSCFGSVAS